MAEAHFTSRYPVRRTKMVEITKLRILHLRKMPLHVSILSILLLLSACMPVYAGLGTLQLSLQGYGSLPGELQNTIIQPDNSVSMSMVINSKVQTANGPAQLTSNGAWVGTRSGSALSGQINGITGRAQICMLVCVTADFVGQGFWNGSLNGSHGSGNFDGYISFTNSPVPQIQNGQPYGISGTWNADFDLPAPEFGLQTPIFMFVVLSCATLLLISTHKTRKSRNLKDDQ